MSDEQNKNPGSKADKPNADQAKGAGTRAKTAKAAGQKPAASEARAGADKPADTRTAPSKDAPPGPAPSSPAKAPSKAAPTAKPPASRGTGIAWLALILSLLVGLAGVAGGYWLWQQLRAATDTSVTDTRLDALEARLVQREAALENALGSLRVEAEQKQAEAERLLTELAAGQQELRRRLDQVGRLAQTSRDEWMRSEAAYLAQIAVYRLNFQADVDTALAALQAADRLLAQLGTEALVQRRAVRDAVNRLLEVEQQDRARLDQALNGLIDQVPQLPLAAERLRETAAAEPREAAVNLPAEGWRARLDEAWGRFTDSLGELVVVRRDDGVLPLVAPEQRYFLRQNLTLRLETARLALHRDDAALYRDALVDAAEWLATWYDADAPGVVRARESLTELAGRELAPELPDIAPLLEPLKLFED
ncbi:uroporphyrinogen-III C-methyltransferase [Alkalilimnicola sp. S0819]|uniref:uroporphyrinogen-III C-methyltransferase n=1 Tax=Alkalilimnicola sp. S0819 TaxID=2613922 RepID=UPI001869E238|nr:uroporphyrinogen-III C-methyltransferase [Alkalilimnicola sp. S0819]